MAITSSAGYPAYTGTFIPEVWSKKLIKNLYKALVVAEITNTDYEGEIKNQGDKVNIRQTPNITIRDYEKGQELQVENPEADTVELLINRAHYFNFALDNIDKVQSDIALLDDWAKDAGMQMKIHIDQKVLQTIYADPATGNYGTTAGADSGDINLGTTGSPVSLTKTNILEKIIDLGTVLDEQDVPEEGRWLTLPPWAIGMLKKSDIKDASLTGDSVSPMRNGRIGIIDRFTAYSTRLLKTATDTVTCYHILAGHRMATTFAAQITEMRRVEDTRTFNKLVQGLNVYGFKTVKPEALADLYCKKG